MTHDRRARNTGSQQTMDSQDLPGRVLVAGGGLQHLALYGLVVFFASLAYGALFLLAGLILASPLRIAASSVSMAVSSARFSASWSRMPCVGA